jgi:hypothetical protein
MKIDREERAKQRLRSAIDHVRDCIRAGGDADHPLEQLQIAQYELRTMQAWLEIDEPSRPERPRPAGL